MNSAIRIGPRLIGPQEPPFVIAEMSGNHNQSLERALEIVEAAAKTGVDALKIQTYTAETMTIDAPGPEFQIEDPESLWKGYSLYQLYKKAYTPWEWHRPIFDRCRQLGLIAFSTPFDPTAVDFLESLGVPCYKIASFENTDLPLITKAAATGKPLIISTGMATVEEIAEAVGTARAAGCRDLILLKCTSSYPAQPSDAHVKTIPDMRERFACQIGLSDHTLGIGVSLAAVALGATLLERHFTLSRKDEGVDAAFSLEPGELAQLVSESRVTYQALGSSVYGPRDHEKGSLRFRRSIYIVEDIKAGEPLTSKNLRVIRPGFGLPPRHYNDLLGKPILKDARRGTAMTWDLVC